MNQENSRIDTVSDAQVLEGIRQVVEEHLDLADPSLLQRSADELNGLRLIDDLALDSIALLTLAVEVENHFQVTLDEFGPDEDFDQEEDAQPSGTAEEALLEAPAIVTLGDLVALIHDKLALEATGAAKRAPTR